MHISGLYIYPIKGCRGIAVDTAAVHDIGLEHDRRFMVVDEHNRFVSQREHPAMARIGVTQTATGWALNRVDLPTLRWDPTPYGAESHVQIWKDTVAVVDQGAEVAAWFSDAIGTRCRLVGFAPGARRLVDHCCRRRSEFRRWIRESARHRGITGRSEHSYQRTGTDGSLPPQYCGEWFSCMGRRYLAHGYRWFRRHGRREEMRPLSGHHNRPTEW